jgi:hypothetical protein
VTADERRLVEALLRADNAFGREHPMYWDPLTKVRAIMLVRAVAAEARAMRAERTREG